MVWIFDKSYGFFIILTLKNNFCEKYGKLSCFCSAIAIAPILYIEKSYDFVLSMRFKMV
jgi:hypothetical protein